MNQEQMLASEIENAAARIGILGGRLLLPDEVKLIVASLQSPKQETPSHARAVSEEIDRRLSEFANGCVSDKGQEGVHQYYLHGIWKAREILKEVVSTLPQPARRATVPIKVRPILVSSMLATDEQGPVILLDSEQDEYEQVVALWHEVLHLLGMTDENAVESIAARLAHACDTVLRGLSSNINVPTSAAPSETPAIPEGRKPVPAVPAVYHEPGWRCPGCERCYGPGKWQCDYCVPSLKDRIRSG